MSDMKKTFLIVESPTKAKTIGRFLGKDFEVMATMGHMRDLPKSKMGVDLDGDLAIDYVTDGAKKKTVSEMVKKAKKSDVIVLATDPDREGEAIAWHATELIKDSGFKIQEEKIKRAVFHEITKSAIDEALANMGKLDMNLVDAQQARRVLDRAVGYTLSPVLWKKVRRGLSGGRVQSVAVRLICEREAEIGKFKMEKYFVVISKFSGFEAELKSIDGKRVTSTNKIKLFDGDYSFTVGVFKTEAEAKEFVNGLSEKFTVSKVTEKDSKRSPLPPFTTSKLQQAAFRVFGWSGKQTMSVAQKLYEKGLITYHRTDSVYLSSKAIDEFRNYIGKTYGANYVASKIRVFANKSKNAQEAHEAIRPTRAEVLAETIGEAREVKLYSLIWKRAVATQGASAIMKRSVVELTNNKAIFEARGVRMIFDGFLRISGEKLEDVVLPVLKVEDELKAKKVEVIEKETNPPPRYTDASLVSSLEKQGIGRPSTYAPIISTIIARMYVEREEGKFKPTSVGMATNEFLVKNYLDILSLPFTAEMEEDLDEVAQGKLDWKKMIKDFWKGFSSETKKIEKEADRVKIETEKMGEKCPECKEGDLVIREGRFGKFISCSRFPECKYSAALKEKVDFKCPECGADAVIKRTKKGRKFFGCSAYPKCKWASWKKPN